MKPATPPAIMVASRTVLAGATVVVDVLTSEVPLDNALEVGGTRAVVAVVMLAGLLSLVGGVVIVAVVDDGNGEAVGANVGTNPDDDGAMQPSQ
jgi:hypothetical protein